MIWLALTLWLCGVLLSAFFSGSETGFYRAARVRLVLDGLAGDRVAKGLLWLTNHPSIFVATTLVGNNIANYFSSLAVVLVADMLFTGQSHVLELAAPIALAPVLFVFGELLPKNLYFHAPNRLLRRGGPFLLVVAVLFAPFSALLWVLSKALQWAGGRSPEKLQLLLARDELRRVFQEGHVHGVLAPAQRGLAEGIFAVAGVPVARFATPLGRFPTVHPRMTKADVLRIARRQRVESILVEEPREHRRLVGYVRVAELRVSDADTLAPVRPLMVLSHDDAFIDGLIKLNDEPEATLARVVNPDGRTVGILSLDRLQDAVFRVGR